MSILNNSLLLGAPAGATGYQVSRSLRFNSADSAYLSRTPASAGNRKTWTWSAWVKRTKSSSGATYQSIFTAGIDGNNNSGILFDNSDRLEIWNVVGNVNVTQKITSQVFRDFSSWYHLVVSATSSTLSLYVNGVEVTAWATNNQPGNEDWSFNAAITHYLARYWDGSSSFPGDFYLADIWFLDGIATDASSFGETDATTGQWIPKTYSGSKGSNGFHLEFADNSNNTASTLGKDTSGNGNNWTPNNLSVTAGAGNDSLVDTLSSYGTDDGLGGSVRGNYATLNPLTASSYISLSNGNLDSVGTTSADNGNARSTIGFTSGKWYIEFTCGSTASNAYANNPRLGIIPAALAGNPANSASGSVGYESNSCAYYRDGRKFIANSASSYGASWTTGDVIGVAIDADNGAIYFSKNGTYQNSGVPTSGASKTGAAFTWTGASIEYVFALSQYDGTSGSCNFGQRSWAYQAPAGFKALVDTNLTAPVIAKPSGVFDIKLWTGNGSTQTISGYGFSPDFVWVKQRSSPARSHWFTDTVRGVDKLLASDQTSAEVVDTNCITAFNSDGFNLADDAGFNASSCTYAGWAWDAGTSTVTNTQGSITSQVRANASAGFSIVTYTTTGSASTVGHGLGVAPSLIITKQRNGTTAWYSYHASIGANNYLLLNSTAASAASSGIWNNTAPTSTVFTVGSGFGNGETYVAYCFAPVAGYSSFGSYTGNGSADGPFVYTGFRPRWVMIKRSDSASASYGWFILDTARNTYNVMNTWLAADNSAADGADIICDTVANGFKIRTTAGNINTNAGTFVYACFAESPFAYARAR